MLDRLGMVMGDNVRLALGTDNLLSRVLDLALDRHSLERRLPVLNPWRDKLLLDRLWAHWSPVCRLEAMGKLGCVERHVPWLEGVAPEIGDWGWCLAMLRVAWGLVTGPRRLSII